MGLFINFVLLFLLWFGIHLHSVTANKILTNLLKAMLIFNPYCWSALHITWTPTFGSSCHTIPHNLLSDEHVWAHPCCLTPPHEKNRWFNRSHASRNSIWSRWRLPVDLRQGWSLVCLYLSFIFVRLPLCNKYYDYCDIYLYTLCYYICCLLWRMYEMHPALSLKPECDRSGIRGMLTVGRNLDRNGQPLPTYLFYSDSFLNSS
jgi:hypothetical protein